MGENKITILILLNAPWELHFTKRGDIYSLKNGKSATAKISIINSINVNRLSEGKHFYFFASLLIRGQLLKERICSSRSKFFP